MSRILELFRLLKGMIIYYEKERDLFLVLL